MFDETLPQGWIVPLGWTAEFRDDVVARCRSCHAEILWARTPAGTREPLNRDGTSHFDERGIVWRKRA